MRWSSRLAVALALLAGFLLPAVASAHEHRDVANGRYTMIVGFLDEPAYTGFKNGLSLEVFDKTQAATPAAGAGDDAADGAPVEGLEETLQAEIIFGDQKMPLTLEPRWQTPGAYDAWVVPMAAGDYSFHITGTIGDTAIDETFTSSPEGFSSVVDQKKIQFPQQAAASTTSAPVFGTVASGGTGAGTSIAALAGAAIGAAGLLLLQRRRRPAVAPARMGIGD